MPRVAVNITELPSFLVGANLTGTTGQADDESLALDGPPTGLLFSNKNASAVALTLELPASHVTFNKAQSITQTVPGAVGGVEGKRMVMVDMQAVAQSDGTLQIDSADANIADVTLYGIRWVPTRI